MMEQPKQGDGERAWRQYAGELRQQLGEVSGRLTTAAVSQLGTRAANAEESARVLAKKLSRSEYTLNNIERDLEAGDIDRARGRLAGRRRKMEKRAARGKR